MKWVCHTGRDMRRPRAGTPSSWRPNERRAPSAAAFVTVLFLAGLAACASGDRGDAGGSTAAAADQPEGLPQAPTDAASGTVLDAGAEGDDPSVGGDGAGRADLGGPDRDDRIGPPARCADRDPQGEPVRITLWHSLSGERTLAVLDDLVDRFRLEVPGVEVELVAITGYRAALQQLRRTDVDALPDLFMGAVDDLRRLVDSGLFVAPERCRGGEPEVLADLLDVVRVTATIDDSVQAYPFNVSTPVMIYDRTMFDDNGLDPDRPPRTPGELRSALEVLVGSGAAPAGLVMYDRSGAWLIEQWAANEGRVLVEPDNGRDGHPVDGVRFATDEAIAAFDWLKALADDQLLTWVGTNQSGIDDLIRLVDLSDRAAITFHTSASLGELTFLVYEAGLPDLDDAELGVAPLPTPSGQPGALVGGGLLWLVDRDDPVTLGAAADLAEFLVSPSVQARFAAATGYVPATLSAADSPIIRDRWAQFPYLRVAYEQLVAVPPTPAAAGAQIGPRVLVQRVLEEAAAAVVFGTDPAEALSAAEVTAMQIIEGYETEVAPP